MCWNTDGQLSRERMSVTEEGRMRGKRNRVRQKEREKQTEREKQKEREKHRESRVVKVQAAF